MAVIINSVGSDKFSLNGKTYSRIFQPLAAGLTHVAIYNTFDTRLQIVGPTHYSEFVVNGTSYGSQTTLIQGLLNVVYISTGGGGGSGDAVWGSILGTIGNQGDLMSALGGKENTFTKNTAFNKNYGTTAGTVSQGNHSHTFASLTSKPTTLAGYGLTSDFNSKGDARWLSSSLSLVTTNTAQEITGDKTFSGNITFKSLLQGRFPNNTLSHAFQIQDSINRSDFYIYNKTGGVIRSSILNTSCVFSLTSPTNGEIMSSSDSIGYPVLQMPKTTTRFRVGRFGDYLPDYASVINGHSLVEGNFTATGNITATAFFESSDKRLKTNIEPISETFKSYEMKDNPTKRYGVIAQDIIKTNPELIKKDDDGMLSVNYTDLLVMKLAEAENRITRLEDLVEKLLNK